ncbi:YqhR family membrane protein [Cytobacillus sp. Hm23]
MESEQQALEQNQKETPLPLVTKVIVIGLCGGLLWSSISYLAYILNFTELSPNLVLLPWAIGDWKNQVLGNVIGIIVIGLLSILTALLYYGLFKKYDNLWVGILYGVGLWLLVFYLFNPIFPGLKDMNELSRNTVITTICVYILYGVFIGYSISFEVNELNDQSHPQQPSTENE